MCIYGSVSICFYKYGHPATGYFIYKNNLYYADPKGSCYLPEPAAATIFPVLSLPWQEKSDIKT